ncbi:DegT/DnrJ/EryC1/StrS family aminotransferase [Blastochloris viridis]|uniref:L-glutamine:2-deoxy-scyllo-inosose aminotransferase n=1 Tax=Blastochloris viridis TaxID=1079 RepID=A0A0P0JI53_BLAVI|nr:DegT/DnrJ/EryC1/StrS family aminotransferase [Blastochloris viridis]ALK08141.1 3-amino-5-hydroxybenzoate synthase [Blastochloris viridis]CUU44063.1 L-glutamine:2-deoxy-scyllo-inosose aminotransferase [Blastochloris viridis]
MLDGRPHTPALLGGPPAVTGEVPPWPPIDPDQDGALLAVARTQQWWSKGGRAVMSFERGFAAAHGARHGIACTNGTHALELALRALGVGPGDEVIVPAMTFVATSMAVMLVGARPVPVDVAPDTWCLDVAACRRAIGPHTRAIVPVHFAGHIADMAALTAMAEAAGLHVIEDAAHAHGARRGGISAGAAAPLAAFSFQNFKLMTAGEGGLLLANDDALAERARLITNCGRPDGDRRYAHLVLGSNMRMTEFQGAVLAVQLARLDARAELRARRARQLRDVLARLGGLRLQAVAADVDRHAWYMVVMEIEPQAFGGLPRQSIVDALNAEGVPAYRIYPAVQDVPHFAADFARRGGDPAALAPTPVARRLAERGIWLHHRILLGGDALIDQVGEAFHKIAVHADAIRTRI